MNICRYAAGLVVCLFLSLSRLYADVAVTLNSAQDIPISAAGYSASGTISFSLNFAPATGSELMVVKNTGLAFIEGKFSNLAQGELVVLPHGGRNYKFVANYYGGSGNDLVLAWEGTRPMAWGLNTNGQLGDGTKTNRRVPTDIAFSSALAGKTVISVAAGGAHTLALCSDGTVLAWGDNSQGQLGDGTRIDRKIPQAVSLDQGNASVVAIAAGQTHSLALFSDGNIAAWGGNKFGQLGDNTTTRQLIPVQVYTWGTPLMNRTPVAIAAGKNHSLALCSDGTVCAWGANNFGQLGNRSTENEWRAVSVNLSALPSGATPQAIASGGNYNIIILSGGFVAAWGQNIFGATSSSIANSKRVSMPIAIFQTDGWQPVAFAAGANHFLATTSETGVTAWGLNQAGQLGVGQLRSNPGGVGIAGELFEKTVVGLSAGKLTSRALCKDGKLLAWGFNKNGQLGIDSTARKLTPWELSSLGGGQRFTKLALGPTALHSVALVASPLPSGPEISVFKGTVPQQNELHSSNGIIVLPPTVVNSSDNSVTFTLKNTGLLNLTGLSINISGAQSAEFSASSIPSILAPVATCVFTITFSPSSAGTRSAVINIVSNDSDENPFVINLAGLGTNTSVPEIAVFDGTSTSTGERVSGNGNAIFPTAMVVGSSQLTFTIQNIGPANLTGLAATVVGTNASDFSVGSIAQSTLTQNSSTTFTVTFSPTAAASRAAAIRIASNDADENPFVIHVVGNGSNLLPEIAVFDGLTIAHPEIQSGGSATFPATTITHGYARYLLLKNTGTGALSNLAVSLSGSEAADFEFGTLSKTSLAPGETVELLIGFAPQNLGLRSAVLSIVSNDGDENPFVIHVSATGLPTAPDISVFEVGSERQNNAGVVNLGSVAVGATSSSYSFTIANEGTAALSGLGITKAGNHSDDFFVSNVGVNTVETSETTTFLVTFSPSATGTRTAMVQIASNDPDENPFIIHLTGVGTPPSSEISVYDGSGMRDG